MRATRRDFLRRVSAGMLVAVVGGSLADDLGLCMAGAESEDGPLHFGSLERLAGLMQDTPVAKLQPLLIDELKKGTSLQDLVASAALANARKFGGQDYVGYHALMAMTPALLMAREMPKERAPLPVLKVLYRNTHHIQNNGGGNNHTLRRVAPGKLPEGKSNGAYLQEATRALDMAEAERRFAAIAQGGPQAAFNAMQYAVQDNLDVHRVVLAHRAWSLLDLLGKEHAHTMLRESVRHCIDTDRRQKRRGRPEPAIRKVLPALMDQYKLMARGIGTRRADDAWVEKLSNTIYFDKRAAAAEAVAAALSEGFHPEDVGEAISLAANQLELRDRSSRVHGASAGVHGQDSAHAWRGIARVTDPRNTMASLIVGAYHLCQEGRYNADPYPLASHAGLVTAKDAVGLLRETEDAIRENDQARACAAVQRYGEMGFPAEDVFGLMRRYAISEDGRLHSEKYYITTRDEFKLAGPGFKWRHLLGLTRATASAYSYTVDDDKGYRAPGYEEACRLLGVTA